jgi:hypothetical protein
MLVFIFTITVNIYIIDGLTAENNSLEKLLSIILWHVGKFIGNKYTDKFIDRQNMLKKNYLLYSIGISTGKFNISPTRKPCIMLPMFLFVCQYI